MEWRALSEEIDRVPPPPLSEEEEEDEVEEVEEEAVCVCVCVWARHCHPNTLLVGRRRW